MRERASSLAPSPSASSRRCSCTAGRASSWSWLPITSSTLPPAFARRPRAAKRSPCVAAMRSSLAHAAASSCASRPASGPRSPQVDLDEIDDVAHEHEGTAIPPLSRARGHGLGQHGEPPRRVRLDGRQVQVAEQHERPRAPAITGTRRSSPRMLEGSCGSRTRATEHRLGALWPEQVRGARSAMHGRRCSRPRSIRGRRRSRRRGRCRRHRRAAPRPPRRGRRRTAGSCSA